MLKLKSNNKESSTQNKYTGLIISTTLFAILLVVVISLNYVWNAKIESNNTTLDAVGELSDNALFITNDIEVIDVANLNNKDLTEVSDTFASLKDRAEHIDEIISNLTNGGQYEYEDGLYKPIDKIRSGDSLTGLNAYSNYWRKLKKIADELISSDDLKEVDYEVIELSAAYVSINVEKFYDSADMIYSERSRDSTTLSKKIQYSQLLLLIVVIIYLAVFIFYFIGKLNKSEAELAVSRKEVTNIMQNVPEGLFLVDQNMSIGEVFSSELPNLIGRDDISRKTLDDVLKGLIPRNELEVTESFIQQLFNDEVIEDLISDLNPLDTVDVVPKNFDNEVSAKKLSFKFKRIYDGESISKVLVMVTDITKEVELEARLESERKSNDLQLQTIASILHLDKRLLGNFLKNVDVACVKINDTLREQSSNKEDLVEKASLIYREAHSLKGEASALNLQSFVNSLSEYESIINNLKNKVDLSGNDFLKVAVRLDDLIEMAALYKETSGKLGSNSSTSTEMEETVAIYQRFAKQIAERNGKSVQLEFYGEELLTKYPQEKKKLINDLLNQLIRNAIAHGIEPSGRREQMGKSAEGLLTIRLAKSNDNKTLITVLDDGAGINFNALREKAISTGYCSEEQAAQMKDKDLYKVMFIQGISTNGGVSEDAGRGVGMDIVKDRVSKLDGNMAIKTEQDKFTKFVFKIPNAK